MKAALAARPNDPKVWRDDLEMLFERKDLEATRSAMSKAPPEADTDGLIWLIRGQVFEQEDEMPAAAEAYRHAVTLLPFNAKAHYRLSLVARQLGHRDEAEAQSRRYIELEQWNTDLKKTLDAYSEALQAERPDAIDAAIEHLSRICKGLGLDEDAKGWADELEARKRARKPST